MEEIKFSTHWSNIDPLVEDMGIEERQQREKQERMVAILAAAKRLFARKGYQETSMSDIAEACELGKATLYYYFPTKEDIYREIILTTTREYQKSLEASIRDLHEVGDVVEHLATAHLKHATQDLDFIRLLFPIGKNAPEHLFQYSDTSNDLEAIHQPLEQRMGKLLADTKVNIDPAAFASLLWSYISGLGYKIVQGYDPESLEKEVRLFTRILRTYLEGNTKA